jgi:hypothetical protein
VLLAVMVAAQCSDLPQWELSLRQVLQACAFDAAAWRPRFKKKREANQHYLVYLSSAYSGTNEA